MFLAPHKFVCCKKLEQCPHYILQSVMIAVGPLQTIINSVHVTAIITPKYGNWGTNSHLLNLTVTW